MVFVYPILSLVPHAENRWNGGAVVQLKSLASSYTPLATELRRSAWTSSSEVKEEETDREDG
jgi:hypothetical protein